MNLLPDMIGAILILLICVGAIKSADAWRAYQSSRKTDEFNRRKREHDYIVKEFSNILREAVLRKSK